MLPKHFTFFMDLLYLVFFPGKIITKRNIHIKNIYDKVQLQTICVRETKILGSECETDPSDKKFLGE